MAYRLVGRASESIDRVLLESARRWGTDAAGRYYRLILAAIGAVSERADRPGSQGIPRVPGLRTYHLHSARRLVDLEYRVGEPRHLIIYRMAPDGVVEILSLVHDRMLLVRAARRAHRDASH